jgi:hypothetical protein
MGLVYTLQKDTKELEELIKFLQDNKSEIKDIIIAVRYCDGNLELMAENVPLETKCTVSKMLDMSIDSMIMDSNPDEYVIEIEDDEGEN